MVIPFKLAGSRKTRLAERLGPMERELLALSMLNHVAGAVRGEAAVALLCAEPPAGWIGAWLPDHGGGLNAELARARGDGAFAVIHADLPLIGADDVRLLLAEAEGHGAAIAPDRHGVGTNAIALATETPIDFAFGAASFARFAAQCPGAAIVRRPGLAFDVDTAADLDAAIRNGFRFSLPT